MVVELLNLVLLNKNLNLSNWKTFEEVIAELIGAVSAQLGVELEDPPQPSLLLHLLLLLPPPVE